MSILDEATKRRLAAIARQRTTWLGVAGIVVTLLGAFGAEINPGTETAIVEIGLLISSIVLIAVEPVKKPQRRPAGSAAPTIPPRNHSNGNTDRSSGDRGDGNDGAGGSADQAGQEARQGRSQEIGIRSKGERH